MPATLVRVPEVDGAFLEVETLGEEGDESEVNAALTASARLSLALASDRTT
ncbi:hypothetical protein RB628_22380 [Streptomyces sp. ADMS]|uniref:hypothetical protein n=1 Tax=Streptomyces sp. ADMS TaxID=3071415 RepID=UPI00296F69BA|nr:hypothetical protein [Streptomyces sp. ADMS]MDW4908017.1 hypothetical protein [Streptomyces sp. ADMS]